MSLIWVASKTGKAVHGIDREYITESGDYLRFDISKRMVENNIAIPLPESNLVKSFISQDILERILDEKKAKETYDAYMKKAKEEKENREKSLQQERDLQNKVKTDMKKVAEKVLEEASVKEKKRGRKPLNSSENDNNKQ